MAATAARDAVSRPAQPVAADAPAQGRARADTKRAPTDADSAVGQRIRGHRLAAGMPLSELSARIGVSNPQMHRYECGLTRVAASRLIAIAAALGVSVEMLTSSVPETGHAEEAEVDLLLRAFSAIGQPERRNALIALARSMAAAETGSPG
ncbi:helix-turn-helix domain-containing protein [Paracraurococcus lichenis]|uniref:Helix-turn-helix domain-containing protein n=1 Tax=Paracraurococcus lichenis TaxID=3064888 RepID=A0ABT9EA83_9PROT|nr:helix-turn-helix domain-containing protein [Paracraurococcus sp. LOR1-02]MDO9713088.1 helix-turn-helix domain-containing protein [Paracraurococcus sp. LOR1-02]